MAKIVQDFSLHTHTVGFDGHNSVPEMIDAARDAGMQTIGISNHFIVYPGVKQSVMYPYAVRGGYASIYNETFDEAINKFRAHYDAMDTYMNRADIRVLRGMEVDFFDAPEWRDGFARALEILRPDYCIGAVHFVEHDGKLHNMYDIRNARVLRWRLLTEYWTKVGRAASSGLFNWMAHIDLPKTVGLARSKDWAQIEQAAVRAISGAKTPVEINTGLYRPDCDEPYPSPRIMRMLADKNVPVLLSDDAHKAAQIGRHFDRARQTAIECGIRNFCDVNALLR